MFPRLQAPCPVNFNPADYYIQILSIIPGREDSCKHAVKSICDAFETSSVGIKIKKATAATVSKNSKDAKDKSLASLMWNIRKFQKASAAIEDPWSQRMQLLSPYKVSWIAQFRAVSWRCWLAIKKNPRLTRVKFYQVFVSSTELSCNCCKYILRVIYYEHNHSLNSLFQFWSVFCFGTRSTTKSVFRISMELYFSF